MNQCDGCVGNLPKRSGIHYGVDDRTGQYLPIMVCQSYLYQQENKHEHNPSSSKTRKN